MLEGCGSPCSTHRDYAMAERSTVALNLGTAEAMLGMYDDARTHLQQASDGPPDVATLAAEILVAIDRHDSAEAILAKLQP
jgi:hypothetical protein